MQKIYRKLLFILFCLTLSSCGSDAPRNADTNAEKVSAPTVYAPPISPISEPQTAAPLKVPERVASDALTESGGGWDEAVQKITYQTSADNGVFRPNPRKVSIRDLKFG